MTVHKIRNAYRGALLKSRPSVHALFIPVVYITLATLYILFSGKLAAIVAQNVTQLQLIEQYKGLGYVFITGMLLYVLCYFMLKRIHLQTKLLVQSEKRAVAGMAGACMAHELNNLLMMLSSVSEISQIEQLDPEDIKTLMQDIDHSLEQLKRFSKSLVRMSSSLENNEKQETELAARIQYIIQLLTKHPKVKKCQVSTPRLDAVRIKLNKQLFEQAILNLLINAAQAAAPNGGVIQLTLEHAEDEIHLHIEDNGPGLPEDIRTDIFTPGFTTKEDGSGLGLLCVQAFAESCGGNVSVAQSDLGGAKFSLTIPKMQDKRENTQA